MFPYGISDSSWFQMKVRRTSAVSRHTCATCRAGPSRYRRHPLWLAPNPHLNTSRFHYDKDTLQHLVPCCPHGKLCIRLNPTQLHPSHPPLLYQRLRNALHGIRPPSCHAPSTPLLTISPHGLSTQVSACEVDESRVLTSHLPHTRLHPVHNLHQPYYRSAPEHYAYTLQECTWQALHVKTNSRARPRPSAPPHPHRA